MKIKAAYFQNNPVFGKKSNNFDQINQEISGIKADLLVLPELFATGYTFCSKEEVFSLAEAAEGETFEFLCDLSDKINGVVVGGFVEKDGKKVFNSAMLVYKKELIGIYRKIHLYNKEKLWFSLGDKPFCVYEVNGIKIGIMICFDWFFPESARTLTLMGAEIIAHPANLVMPFCQNAMVTRCLENNVFAVTANRIGEEKRGNNHSIFTGNSQITSINGEIISRAPIDSISSYVAELDLNKARDKHLNPFNDKISDRRVAFYKQS